ncbi:uncharacterized protein [Eurosta solidaginis]|uniref:uncharacterized protein n=1 Tax=Eurosta solidaginis TaxID=178769 RepID=UPI003530CC2A
MLSFAGFTAIRHYALIMCLIILFVFLFLLLLLLGSLYVLTACNSNTNITTITLNNSDFETQTNNKLSENPNSQQQQETLKPQILRADHRRVDGSIGDTVDASLVVEHNNLPKSRIVGGSNAKVTTNSITVDRKSIADTEPIRYSKSENQVNSGVNSHFIPGNSIKGRNKRVIIFSGGGVVKFVVGVSFPIDLGDKQRSLSHFYNLQGQFPPPMRPTYWWNYFNSSSFAARRQQRKQNNYTREKLHHRLKHDVSRELIYTAIEQIYERNGLSGESCLLQAICEVSQLPFHVPRIWENHLGHLWHAILNAVLIPTLQNVDIKYLHAGQAGRFGADCRQAFRECPQRVNMWLRNVARTI